MNASYELSRKYLRLLRRLRATSFSIVHRSWKQRSLLRVSSNYLWFSSWGRWYSSVYIAATRPHKPRYSLNAEPKPPHDRLPIANSVLGQLFSSSSRTTTLDSCYFLIGCAKLTDSLALYEGCTFYRTLWSGFLTYSLGRCSARNFLRLIIGWFLWERSIQRGQAIELISHSMQTTCRNYLGWIGQCS